MKGVKMFIKKKAAQQIKPLKGEKVVKVMADYECYPLWGVGAQGYNIPPEELKLSKGLTENLYHWAGVYDSTLNRADPISSGFISKDAEIEFVQNGRNLAHQVKIELGKEYIVHYYDQLKGATEVVV